VARWQALPDTLPPEVRHLVEQLRRLKDRTGLSLVELGERTAVPPWFSPWGGPSC
jgi:hypothetical protein